MKALFNFCKLSLFLFLILNIFTNCQNKRNPVFSGEPILIEENFKPKFKILEWKDGKKAAYTLTFDDARESHHKIAWPEMQKRGIVGTFNINTPDDLNWIPWKYLAEFGNEIASHSVNHPDMTSLSASQIEYELSESFNRIKKNIRTPYSFTHPFGLTNVIVDEKIKQYYLSGRWDFGINSKYLQENEFFQLKSIGIFPTISRNYLQQMIKKTIEEEGYLIVAFHSLTDDNYLLNETYMPIQFFQDHLDDILENSDDLWIAPQAEVIKYIKLRKNSSFQIRKNSTEITYSLKSDLDKTVFNIPLSIETKLPQNWKRKKIVKFSKKLEPFSVIANSDSILTFNVGLDEEIILKAF